jgi:hypothetical protein
MFDWDDDGDVDSGDWALSYIFLDGVTYVPGPKTLFGWILTILVILAAAFIWYLETT